MAQPAVVFVPPGTTGGDADDDVRSGMAHCTRRGYRLRRVIWGDWKEAQEEMSQGVVVVLARAEHAGPMPTEVVGDETRRILRAAVEVAREVPSAGRHRRLARWRIDCGQFAKGLTIATAAAGPLWVGLETADLPYEGVLYALVWTVLGSWLPFMAYLINCAWRDEVAAAAWEGQAVGQVIGYRKGYPDGFVDCATLKES